MKLIHKYAKETGNTCVGVSGSDVTIKYERGYTNILSRRLTGLCIYM